MTYICQQQGNLLTTVPTEGDAKRMALSYDMLTYLCEKCGKWHFRDSMSEEELERESRLYGAWLKGKFPLVEV